MGKLNNRRGLLDTDGGAEGLEGFLQLLCLFLCDFFFDHLRGGFDKAFRLQTWETKKSVKKAI